MKRLILITTLLALAACSGQPERATFEPRELAADDRSACRLVSTIVKRAAGYTSQSINTSKAMEQGLEAVREAGGNAYYVLDVDTSASVRGAQVILEAYACG